MLAVQMVQAVLKDAKMRDHANVIQREVSMLMGDVARLVEHVTDSDARNSTVVFGHARKRTMPRISRDRSRSAAEVQAHRHRHHRSRSIG
jgi:DNA anti-recombination protein RmuC